MATVASLNNKAEQCLAKAVDIPGAPLWHLGLAAKLGARTSFDKTQKAIDYLACRAKARLPIDPDGQRFLKELYEAFWWGGHYRGYKEAAALANHYVHGNGTELRIDESVYKSSIIVSDTCAAMKVFIRDVWKQQQKVQPMLSSSDPTFRHSAAARVLARHSGRSQRKQGHLLPEGTLLAEQDNARLQKTDNRFYLKAYLLPLPDHSVHTRWRVDSIYDFEPFEKADHMTEISLTADLVILLPDGLSQWMAANGIAKTFAYYAQWHETWAL